MKEFKMIFRNMKYLLLLLVFSALNSCTNTNSNNSKSESNNQKKQRLFLSSFKTSDNITDLKDSKGQAAFGLAVDLTNKFTNINLQKRDSISKEWAKLSTRATVFTMAQELEADKMVFIYVNKLENILRVDLDIVDMEDTVEKKFGKGYSHIKYRDKDTESQIYDTALLEAIQRALANVTNDSLLYDEQKGSFRVHPLPIVVIGGLDFQENSENLEKNTVLSKWNLFKNKEINSFDAVETVFEEVYKSKKYLPYDVASRDSMFAYFGMYGIDNCHLPSIEEINILSGMQVDYYIFGVINKIENKAKITLSLNKVMGKELITKKVAEGEIVKDDILELRAEIKRLTLQLLE